ncbi:hypothetical protein GCM10027169_25540 [Gordonia jinhuaensis]|uniref:Uncharacterized protein n=1 Tax=Gordonia jinhuaensis TaxID=1517702 RepID=A0A916TCF2_9ACTN|nr:hypothetical protein [Gordonia jinhuaensis]GGB39631.1 hypothetical protein GCM10011489_29140 [Gordonia jinhuaensis]
MQSQLVGRIGVITVPVRATNGSQGAGADRLGEVELVINGVHETYLCTAATDIDADRDVLVIGDEGARRLVVEPWTALPGRR